MEIENYIKIRENFLDKHTLRKLNSWIQNDLDWKPGTIISKGTEVEKNIRSVDEFALTFKRQRDATTSFWYNYLCHLFWNFSKIYAEKNNFIQQNFLDNFIDLTILKYTNNNHYEHHTDYHHSIPRQLSFVYFLNDNFEGGEFEFAFNQNYRKKIKCKANSAIIFPSNFMFQHKVYPVTKGIRYTVVGWMR